MWCIYVCCVRCHAPILFTRIVLVSHLAVKGRCTCEIGVVGTNNKLLGGPGQQGRYNKEESWQEAQSNLRTRPEWTYSWGASRDSRSNMYIVYMVILLQSMGMLWVVYLIFCSCLIIVVVAYIIHCLCIMISSAACIIHSNAWCLFSLQVKNKPWPPWVYSWIWHHREQ
jgi:hypothetical protein